MFTDRRIRIAWNILKIIFSVLLVGFFLSWVDLKELSSLSTRLSPSLLVVTFVLYASLSLLKAVRYQQLIPQKTAYPRILNIVIIQNALSNFLANGAGILSSMALFRLEENVKIRQSGVLFIITTVADLFAVWLVSIPFSWLLWLNIYPLQEIIILVLLVMGLGFLVFFAALQCKNRFITSAKPLLAASWLEKFSIIKKAQSQLDDLAQIPDSQVRQVLLNAFGLSAIYYGVTLAWMIASLKAFGFQADIVQIIFVSCILQLFSMLPVSAFGGLGITELTSVYLYSMLGVSQVDLVSILLGWRILYYLSNLVMVFYLPLYALFIERGIKTDQV